MFQSLKRVVYKVTDIEQAKQWYTKVLNRQPLFDSPFAVIFKINDCSLSLSKVDHYTPGTTEMIEVYWEVENIDEVSRVLVNNGATIHTPVKDVMNVQIAKLIDPFGNIIGLSGSSQTMKDRTIENKPSETAYGVTYCRALAAKDEREEIRGADYLAELFLTDEGRKSITDRHSREWSVKNIVTSALYGYIIARTAYVDNIFHQALSGNFAQVVFLGAGYDTRAYRFRKLLNDTRVFELDISSTQKNKIAILNKADIEIPKQVSFVSVNFKKDSLANILSNAGYDENAKTLFIWEGVTYYLERDNVINTLQYIHDHAPVGSLVCFDYLIEQMDSVNPAEPFLFWIQPNEMAMLLSGQGFEMVENVGPQEIERRHLVLKDGTLAEKTLPFFYFMTAKVTRQNTRG